jgi:geranylgeranyl diphosphate synthase type II
MEYWLIIILIVVLIIFTLFLILQYSIQTTSISNPRKSSLPSVPPLNSLVDAQDHINNSLEVAEEDLSFSLEESDKHIINAINHSVQGGKRLRSALCLDIASRSATRPVDATEMALVLEYLHGASLIIDDMPHFDNDDVRRGRASTHILYGAATSQMAATGLTALSMECLVRQGDSLRKNVKSLRELTRVNLTVSKLMMLVSDTMGVKGLSGGQLAEYCISKKEKRATLASLESIIKRKTGSLFEAAVISGWIIGNSTWSRDPTEYENKLIKEIANHYGMAFQIADDIGDKDKDNGNINYCVVRGIDEAQYRLEEELRLCKEKLKILGLWSNVWEDVHKAARMMISD